jgi:HKD family nuclease
MFSLHLHRPHSGNRLSDAYTKAFAQAVEIFVVTAYLTEWDAALVLNPACRHFRLIVGKDFGITRSAACRKVMGWLPSSRKAQFLVADRIDGFHPKAVFWREKDGRCFCIIGSSNLTLAAFGSNYEANVLCSLPESEYATAKAWVKQIEELSVVVSEAWLLKYKEAVFSSQSTGNSRSSSPGSPIASIPLPRPRGMAKVLEERRQALAAYSKRRPGLEKLFQRCAARDITSLEFFDELPKHWSSALGDRLQGLGWERRGKQSDFQELSISYLAIVAASASDRDDRVQQEVDRLGDLRVEARGAFLSEMLCLRFPRQYPVLNDPIWRFIEDVSLATPRGASDGAKYIYLAKTLRTSLQDDPTHPAKSIAELDTVLWLKYRRRPNAL